MCYNIHRRWKNLKEIINLNRLKLDFSLNSIVERTNFLNKYIKSINFTPNEDELETMANYILWGKDPQTGLNVKQSKEVKLESRNKTWDAQPVESLDALLEAPGFTETMIKQSEDPSPKIARVVFSREEARQNASPEVLERLEELWKQIDELDLLLNFYDLKVKKRKKPPRSGLLQLFTEEKIQHIQNRAESLSQFHYLKLRHLLVELRREQFTLRDTYITPNICAETAMTPPILPPTMDSEILCAPVGLKYKNEFTSKLFPIGRFPIPTDFTESELKQLISFYWKRKQEMQSGKIFNFAELEHVYQALLFFYDLEDDSLEATAMSTSPEFLDTLNFYINRAYLTPVHRDILNLKMKHYKNQLIADTINKKYGKTYTANYISTIFRQKIIPQINEAARQHVEIIENLCYPENWKKCRHCGKTLLVNTDNFVRKSRSSDGFSNQCKRCDKEIRQQKK